MLSNTKMLVSLAGGLVAGVAAAVVIKRNRDKKISDELHTTAEMMRTAAVDITVDTMVRTHRKHSETREEMLERLVNDDSLDDFMKAPLKVSLAVERMSVDELVKFINEDGHYAKLSDDRYNLERAVSLIMLNNDPAYTAVQGVCSKSEVEKRVKIWLGR